MFSQDYDFADDLSDVEAGIADEESSDDDDLQRMLRKVAGLDAEPENDFEKSMEAELSETVKQIESSRRSDLLNPQQPSTSGSSTKLIPSISNVEKAAAGTSKKKVKFAEAVGSDEPKEFYDQEYFDSDEEGATEEGVPSGPKKHPVISEEDLFFDPKMDDADQRWMDQQRRSHLPAADQRLLTGSKRKKSTRTPETDAVLDCPACMVTLCVDCQRHEVYHEQYRAMFVSHCQIDRSKSLVYKSKERKRKGAEMQEATEGQKDVYHSVKCTECGTEVGVVDSEEVYHFFNVIASHP